MYRNPRKEFQQPQGNPEKHDQPAAKRGLSDERMCICAAADREGRVVARCVNRAKPTAENIGKALGGARIVASVPCAQRGFRQFVGQIRNVC